MDQLLTGLLLTLVGAYIAYLLTKSYNRRLRKREVVSELAESLRHTLPPIQQGIEDAYLFSSDINQFLTVLKDYELKLGHRLLSGKVKKEIVNTKDLLGEFVKEFRVLSRHLYSYFESMKDRKGSGSVKINTIVATKLVCMSQNELPREVTLIGFPRESRGHFSQVQWQVHQVTEIWQLGQKGNSEKFRKIKSSAILQIAKLDRMLSKIIHI